MSHVLILGTGGTIAGTASDPGRSWAYQAAQLSVEQLVAAVPELAAVSLATQQVAQIDSKDMGWSTWQALGRAIEAALLDDAVSAIVVTHGTDTLEETAYFLHLTLETGKPVVLTGAMRPADHPAADGPANLLAAVRLASSDEARNKGVLAVMNGQAHGARHLVKARTGGLDAFESSRAWTAARPDGRFAEPTPTVLPRVDILPGYAGAPAGLIDACVADGARGLVLALTGHGSVPAAWLPALRRARDGGVAILRASRCAGPVIRNANADDDREGWLTAGDLPPPKARIALMLALAGGYSGSATQASLLSA